MFLVVGAGPTGLLMAAELARFGLPCRIIEKSKIPSDKSRALVIQPRTLEIFDQLGIVDRFLSAGMKLHAANPRGNGKPLARIAFDEIDSPYNFILSLEQTQTEKILTEYLESFDIQVERGVELSDFQQDENGVHTNLQEEPFEGLIGCDGAHSIVRKGLDLGFQGKQFDDIFSLADIHIEWDLPHDEIHIFLEKKTVMAAFPMPEKNRYRLVFLLERGRGMANEEHMDPPTLDEVQDLLSSHNAIASKPLWMSNFHINSRLADAYQVDRIFLAGDAAHIHSPVGGQGMNTGLQDVFNLAWKLATKDPNVIQTYAIERRGTGKRLLSATDRGSTLVTLENPLALFLRNHLAPLIMPHLTKQMATAISQIGISYPETNTGPRKADILDIIRGTKTYHYIVYGDGPDHPIYPTTHLPAKKGGKKSELIRPDGHITNESSNK